MLRKPSEMKFDAFFTKEGSGAATLRFTITDDMGAETGAYMLEVQPTELGTADGLLAKGNREMAQIVHDWASALDDMAGHYERR